MILIPVPHDEMNMKNLSVCNLNYHAIASVIGLCFALGVCSEFGNVERINARLIVYAYELHI